MKNQSVLIILVACCVQIASGQITSPVKKSTFILGGSVITNFENETIKFPDGTFYQKNFTIGTDAYCGYFISNHVTMGILTDFSIKSSKYSNTLNDNKSTDISNNYSFGPFFRFYTMPGVFFEGAAALGFGQAGLNDNPEKIKNYSFSSGIGYSLFITNSIALEPLIKYKYEKTYWDSEDVIEASNSGIYFSIGLQFYLPSNK